MVRIKNRHLDKKVERSQGRSFKDKTSVLGMIERKSRLIAKVAEETKGTTLTSHIIEKGKQSASVITDEWLEYKSLKRISDHTFVKHNEGEYINGRVYTNTIEGFWSLLKRSILVVLSFHIKKAFTRLC